MILIIICIIVIFMVLNSLSKISSGDKARFRELSEKATEGGLDRAEKLEFVSGFLRTVVALIATIVILYVLYKFLKFLI